MDVDVYDPWANAKEVQHEHGISLVSELGQAYDAIVLTVAHREFLNLAFGELKAKDGVLFDIKSILDKSIVDARL